MEKAQLPTANREHWLHDDIARKIDDLEAVARRASLLQNLTAELAAALSVDGVARIVAAHGRDLFGATASLVYLKSPDERTLELTALAGIDERRAAMYRQLPIDASDALPEAVRSGEPRWLETHEQVVAAYPGLAAVRFEGARLEGVVAIPLRDTKRVIGGLAFSFYAPLQLDAIRRDFFLTVASLCGATIERARAFEAERLANQRLERQQQRIALLAEAAEKLTSTLDSRAALAELARYVVPAVADWCGIDELADDGRVRRLAVHHRDPEKVALAIRLDAEYPPRPEDDHGVMRVLRTGETQYMRVISDELLVMSARDERHLEIARALRLCSFAVVPIRARGKVLGALSLVNEGERYLEQEDLAFAEELARRAGLALDNARLYEAAEAARGQLHDLFMNAPAPISVMRGPDLRFELANEPYVKLLEKRDVVGRPFAEAFPELESQGSLTRIQRVFDTGEPCAISELPIRMRWGDTDNDATRYFNIVYQPTRDARGRVDGVATYSFEVTDQVRARHAIEELASRIARSEERLRGLVHATAAITWTATAQGEVVDISPSWLAFTGQTAEQYRNGGFLEAIHPEDRAPTMAVWTENVSAGAPYATEYRLRRADGSYAYTLARGYPVRDVSGKIVEYVGCNVDVSELRRAEARAREDADALRAMNEELERTNKELDQFAYVTSHDLRAPLRGIGSLAEWIEEDLGEKASAETKEQLKLLRGRVHRMEGLIQGILDYSRAARGRTRGEDVDVGKLLNDIVDLLNPKPPARVAWASLPTLRTERVALQQVLMNLIGNALKHGARPDLTVHVEAKDLGDVWQFCVRDDGKGIAPKYQDRIWGIFQTLEARDIVESTGIGLAIVRKIVEARQGRAWIESEEAHGAAFFFTWPKKEQLDS